MLTSKQRQALDFGAKKVRTDTGTVAVSLSVCLELVSVLAGFTGIAVVAGGLKSALGPRYQGCTQHCSVKKNLLSVTPY